MHIHAEENRDRNKKSELGFYVDYKTYIGILQIPRENKE